MYGFFLLAYHPNPFSYRVQRCHMYWPHSFPRVVHGVGGGLNVCSLVLKIQGLPQASSSMEPHF